MLLAFEVVLFGGLAFMFFCILRNQDSMLKTMREEHGAILSTLAKLEKRIATLQQLEAIPWPFSRRIPRKRSRNYPKRGTALPSPPRNRPLPSAA